MRFLLLLSCLVLSLTACARDGETVLRGKVTHVADGDTADVKLQSGVIRVRFYGIDAPEKDQPWGNDAATALRQLIGGKEVELIPVEQDKYDRLVAVVMLGERNVNLDMVARGNAWAFRHYLGDFADDSRYCEWEAKARDQQLGLWRLSAKERHAPWEWRHRAGGAAYTNYDASTAADCVSAIHSKTASVPVSPGKPPSDCAIKGNISADGQRIYHVPGSVSYADTMINQSAGERWFCSEAEAQAAGWRAPKN